MKLWKSVDNKSFGSSFNELGVSGSYPWVMQGFSTSFSTSFSTMLLLPYKIDFLVGILFPFVFYVSCYAFKLTTNHLFSHPIK